MNLETLAETIETLKARIERHRPELSENETRTRAALINPLLHALGWDAADPALVKIEYSVGSLRADYALMGHDGKPAAVFEAKRLGESLDDHQIQTLNYANREGVGYAGLTDGNRWELYSVFEQAPLKERRRIYISIVEDPPHECALKLLTLWRPNLASGQPVEAADPIFKDEPPAPEPEPTPTPEPPPTDGWTPLSEYRPKIGAPRPFAIRLPDGSERSIRTWIAVLMTTAEWLCENNLLTTDKLPVPVSSRSRTYIVSASNVHGTGREMQRPGTINNGRYYVDKDITCDKICRNATRLLEECGADPSETYIKQSTANDVSRSKRRQKRWS